MRRCAVGMARRAVRAARRPTLRGGVRPARSLPVRARRALSAAAPSSRSASDPRRFGDPSRSVLRLAGVTKSVHPSRPPLLRDVNLQFYHGAKVGVVGVNGSGKTTLLRILAGEDRDHDGEVERLMRGMRVGYLRQEPELDEDRTVMQNVEDGIADRLELLRRFEEISAQFAEPDADFDALMAEQAEVQDEIERRGCWDLTHRVELAMEALRCPPGDWGVTTLSGGERRRVALARLLLSEPDMLVLDEPTNHLDAESVAWLERFLHDYPGLVVAVTHDRYFLDSVAAWILEVDGGRARPYQGNYADFLEQKRTRLDLAKAADAKRARLMDRELEWVRTNAKGRRAKSKARLEAFHRMSAEERQHQRSESGALIMPQGPRLGGSVVRANGLGKEIDGRRVFRDVTFSVGPGDVLGIVGPNGSGKSTLVRLLVGEDDEHEGALEVGDTVRWGHISQSREELDPHKTVWQEICGDEEVIELGGGRTMPARQYVAQFNFVGPNQSKAVEKLSGGERNRVQLAKSLKTGANVICLDEPTNDLDVDTLRALEEALVTFDGSAIVVSHDRYFLDRIATKILAFEDDGTATFVVGSYSEYEEQKEAERGAGTGGGEKKKKKAHVRL